MKRGRPSTGCGTSRNTDYYVKRIRASDSSGCGTITGFFGVPSKHAVSKDLDLQNKSDVGNASNTENITQENKSKDENASNIEQIALEKQSKDENAVQQNKSKDESASNIEHIVQEKKSKDEIAVDENKSNIEDFEIENESESEMDMSDSEDNSQICIAEMNKNIPYYERLYSWLYYSPAALGFLCKTCSLVYHSSNTPWISTGVNFKKGGHPTRTIKKHENSRKHKQSVTISQKARKSIAENIYEGAEVAEKLKSNFNRQVISKYIKILYFMSKKQWPVSENFESLVRFLGNDLEDKEIAQYLNTCGKNATYLSHVSVENILYAISLYIEEKTLTELTCSDFFSILADESTDECQREQLGIIVRYKLRSNKDVQEKYLGLVNLTSTKAEDIMTAIEKLTVAKNINLSNCLFIGLDGANVMSGELTGVQRRMKQHSPHCIYINCRNHRLALVFAHLVKKYDVLQSIDSLLVSLWKLFHYSPKKAQIFKEIQANVYNENILKMIKVSVTRWLSHGQACERISSRFKELVETIDSLFHETKDPELKGLREQLLTPDIILAILFLADFLAKVDKLNLWLQSPSISFSLISIKVTRLIEEIEKYCLNLEKGENFKRSKDLITLSHECTSLSQKTRSKNLNKENQNFIQEFKENFVTNFVNDFKIELKIAFEIKSNVLSGFDIFNNSHLEELLNSNENKDDNIANSSLSILLSHYGEEKSDTFQNTTKTSSPIIDRLSVVNEKEGFEKEVSYAQMTFDIEKTEKARELLKKGVKEDAKNMMNMKMTPFELLNILERDSNNWISYPNFMKLLTLSVIIPCSTASVERLFSRMNLVCTELRTRLKQETLDQHLRIIINGPPSLSKKECEKIINIFKSSGNRRLLL